MHSATVCSVFGTTTWAFTCILFDFNWVEAKSMAQHYLPNRGEMAIIPSLPTFTTPTAQLLRVIPSIHSARSFASCLAGQTESPLASYSTWIDSIQSPWCSTTCIIEGKWPLFHPFPPPPPHCPTSPQPTKQPGCHS